MGDHYGIIPQLLAELPIAVCRASAIAPARMKQMKQFSRLGGHRTAGPKGTSCWQLTWHLLPL
jgi:hypothetical protein